MIWTLGGWASWVAKVTWGRFAPRFGAGAGDLPLHGLDLEAGGGGPVALRAEGGLVALEAGGGGPVVMRTGGGLVALEAGGGT